MKRIERNHINGAFVPSTGTQIFSLVSPSTRALLGTVTLGSTADAELAISAARHAFGTWRHSSRAERIEALERMYTAVDSRRSELIEVMIAEYGGTRAFCTGSLQYALGSIRSNIELLQDFPFERTLGSASVLLDPVGVVGIITPWNSSTGFICAKLSTALAAGCTAVIKPSELSAAQTDLLAECLHAAQLPAGSWNIVHGSGAEVGAFLSTHPGIAKISFTGSSATGRAIARSAADTMKRITLELGGKSPNIVLPDADLSDAIPRSVAAAFMNSGQACIAATRLLVPESRLEEVKPLLAAAVAAVRVGDPADVTTAVGPLVSETQYERVQRYIRLGIEEGAEVLTGGTGHPEGLESGWYVKPTVFVNAHNAMRVAREEIFGPVLTVLTYRDEEDAIAIANDSDYGLAAYVQGSPERAGAVAKLLEAGRVLVNDLRHDPQAPFGGFKQSGIGREYGVYGLEAYLEPKAVLA